MSTNNFGVTGCSLTKLWHLTRIWVGVLTHVQLLGTPFPFKFGKAKNGQKSVRFRTTFEFKRKYLWNRWR